MEPLYVELAERRYPLFLEKNRKSLAERIRETLGQPGSRPMAVVMDAAVARAHPKWRAMMGEWGPVLEKEGGEGSKSVESLTAVWDFLAEHKIDRTGGLFVCGGGVIGDLGGFAAASWLRGISLWQIPTTLLAMVDSSVGGKTGINTPAGKNLVGAFHQPQSVFMGRFFLETLPQGEFSAGMAEVIKAGLLADAELFGELERGPRQTAGTEDLLPIVRKACSIKASVVAADEKETAGRDGRALLNLGHTFGHAIEKVAGYGKYLHGEAVAIGLVMATTLSTRLLDLPTSSVERVRHLLERYELPTGLREPLDVGELMRAMGQDKKNRGGTLRLVLLRSLGEATTREIADPGVLVDLWEEFMGSSGG